MILMILKKKWYFKIQETGWDVQQNGKCQVLQGQPDV